MYRGSAFKQFLIDRLAMGFENKPICEEFEKIMGIPITEAEIETIVVSAADDIKLREQELLHELLSQNTFSALYDIRRQLDEVRQEARASGDLKTYAQLTNSSLKSVEVLIGLTERFKSRQEQQAAIGTQNNILVLNMLEKDGALKIIDVERVKRLLTSTEVAHEE